MRECLCARTSGSVSVIRVIDCGLVHVAWCRCRFERSCFPPLVIRRRCCGATSAARRHSSRCFPATTRYLASLARMVRDVLLLLKSGIACVLMCCVFKMPLFMHLFLARDLVG